MEQELVWPGFFGRCNVMSRTVGLPPAWSVRRSEAGSTLSKGRILDIIVCA